MKTYLCEAQITEKGKYKTCGEEARFINEWGIFYCKLHATLRCDRITPERVKERRHFQENYKYEQTR